MPLRLDIKKKMTQRSDRVKSVDMHPSEPWVLCALYSGKCVIYNYNTGATVRSFDVSDLPIRCAKFIPRKQWIITGADDMQIRVFNYNTLEKIASFEGHQDYIRFIEVHPSQPYVLTTSDDMTIKLWDWEKNWTSTVTYEGHAHYVMMARFNPKDSNTFATASLDRSIKVWSLNSSTPNFSLEGHDRGVNCIDYYPGGDKPYIVSGADDMTLKIWDYQTRSCVATMEGHTNNVCAVSFHPKLPVILSASEDGTVRVWHNTTYRLENTLNYGFERAWAVAVAGISNKIALGFDEGTIVVKLGKDTPIVSMDKQGKLIISRNNVVYSSSVRASSGASSFDDGFDDGTSAVAAPVVNTPAIVLKDGEPVPAQERELGSVEHFPSGILHNPNGRFVAIAGDNEYVIYTAQTLRNKSFGQGLDFVWSAYGTGDYAVRESTQKVKIFRNFKETLSFKPGTSAEGLYGGALLGVRSADAVTFHDWETGKVVRRIEVAAKGVYWNDAGALVAITTDDTFYVLNFSKDAYVQGSTNAPANTPEAAVLADEGVEVCMDLQYEIIEKVRRGLWVGDCFLYTSGNNRLQYTVGGETMTLAHLDRHLYLLGYLPKEGRVYLMDKTGTIVSYALLLALAEYQTAVVRRDFATANRILPDIPREQYNSVAKFLDGQGFKTEALAVADDADLKFDLAVQLGKLEIAYSLLTEAAGRADADSVDIASRWRALMDLALAKSDLVLAEECAIAAQDLSSLMLLYTATGNSKGLNKVSNLAEDDGRSNLAFLSSFVTGNIDKCVELLVGSNRSAEAAIFARTYCPSSIEKLMPL